MLVKQSVAISAKHGQIGWHFIATAQVGSVMDVERPVRIAHLTTPACAFDCGFTNRFPVGRLQVIGVDSARVVGVHHASRASQNPADFAIVFRRHDVAKAGCRVDQHVQVREYDGPYVAALWAVD